MQRFVQCLEAAALIAAFVALIGLIGIERAVSRRLPSILAGAQTATQKFAAASDSLNDAAHKEDSYLVQTSRELNKTVADAHDLLVHTDISLNGRNGRGGLLPAASAAVAEQQAQLDAIERQASLSVRQAQKSLDDLDAAELDTRPALESLNQAAGNLAKASADPRIAESFDRLDAAMGEADATLANLQAVSASGNRDAQMIEKRLRQALKPASLLKSILWHVLGIAGPAAQIAAAAR